MPEKSPFQSGNLSSIPYVASVHASPPCPCAAVWCALDDMTAANGCLAVLPGSQLPAPAGMVRRDLGEAPTQPPAALHDVQQQPQQLQQQGSAQVVALEVPAGTAVITSDTVLHCSGPNRSQHMRCAWMPQFSAAPLTWRAGGGCVSLAIPLQPPEPDV